MVHLEAMVSHLEITTVTLMGQVEVVFLTDHLIMVMQLLLVGVMLK